MADQKITLNLDIPLISLQRSIHTTMQLVSFGLKSLETTNVEDYTLPVFFKFQFEGFPKSNLDEVKKMHKQWILQNGFRDCIEALNLYLDEVLVVYAVIDLGPKDFSGETFNSLLKAAERFHDDGLPKKLDLLSKKYSAKLDSESVDRVKSINVARNCLVHRRGIVQDKDVKGSDQLLVKWTRLRITVVGKSEEREAKFKEVIQPGESLVMSRVATEVSFKKGESLDFTIEVFNEICAFLSAFGKDVENDSKRAALEKGIPQKPA